MNIEEFSANLLITGSMTKTQQQEKNTIWAKSGYTTGLKRGGAAGELTHGPLRPNRWRKKLGLEEGCAGPWGSRLTAGAALGCGAHDPPGDEAIQRG